MVKAVIDEYPYHEPATPATDEMCAFAETSKVSWVPFRDCTKLAEAAKPRIDRGKKVRRETERVREGCRARN